MPVEIAERWFETQRIDDDITLLWEPHVVPLMRCNIWHVRGRDRDLLIDTGMGIASLAEATRHLIDKPVIAVATHVPKPVDAVELRRYLDPTRPAPPLPPPGVPATGCRPDALARTVALTPEGGRNHALFWASCRMAENGLSHADAMSWLMPAALYAGLPDREIETTVNSAFRIASRLGPGSRPGPTPASEGIHL